jgi:hypothetical protein
MRSTASMVGAGFFIFALLLSAVFDPKIRLLHALQALIYFCRHTPDSSRERRQKSRYEETNPKVNQCIHDRCRSP